MSSFICSFVAGAFLAGAIYVAIPNISFLRALVVLSLLNLGINFSILASMIAEGK